MKVLIINGNPKEIKAEFDQYLNNLAHQLKDMGHESKIVILRDMHLNDCIGCYSCWLKTPGICCFNDGFDTIIMEYLAADLVISASPVIMGFVSSLLKRATDRMLPLAHPFLVMKENRMAHIPRYSHYPQTALLLENIPQADAACLAIIEKVYKSQSRVLQYFWNTSKHVSEIANEINNN